MEEKKKHNTDLSTEELLTALEETPGSTESFVSSDPIFSFIQTFNIKEGIRKIKCDLIYDLFKQWNKFSYIKPNKFFQEFEKYFQAHNMYAKSMRSRYYLLDNDMLDIIKNIESYKKTHPKNKHKYKSVKKHFESFLKAHNIIAGGLYIEADVFYHIYDTWVYRNKGHNYLSYERFTSVCSLYFTPKRFEGSELIWFGLDSSIKQYISPQAVANWRQGRARRGKKSKVNEEDQNNIIYPETQK